MLPSIDPEATSRNPSFNFNLGSLIESGLELGASERLIGDIM